MVDEGVAVIRVAVVDGAVEVVRAIISPGAAVENIVADLVPDPVPEQNPDLVHVPIPIS